ncbi:hypothetical protein B0J14DRAFT_608205 [Halenospora varia]|nr:hypothetical protein B0J14DRAFT_608205 [Halenospora varia]
MHFQSSCVLLLLVSVTIAAPFRGVLSSTPINAISPRNVRSRLNATVLVEYPKGTWLENLVIRQSDGNALVTLLSAPEVVLLSTNGEFKPITIASFPNAIGCLGIVELYLDIFYVVAGNWSAHTGLSTPGSYSIWEIDMTLGKGHRARTRKVTDLPLSGFLNGMTVLNPIRGILLVADSLFSAVWSVNVQSGEVAVAANTTEMSPILDAQPPLGINGLRVHGSDLYFDNTNRATFCKIPIDLDTGKSTGAATVLVESDKAFPDDFTIDFKGNAWMAADLYGEMDFLPMAAAGIEAGSSTLEIVVGSRGDIQDSGWTAAKFGTKRRDVRSGALYVTTNGGPLGYIYQNWTAGGMLLRIDTINLDNNT